MIKITSSCEEANHVCDKAQYKEASFWEKIKLNIHLFYCKACRGYTKSNRKLSKLIVESKVDSLDQDYKETMKASLDKAMKENQH